MEILNEYLKMVASNKALYIKNNTMIENSNVSFSELYENVSYDVDIIFMTLCISPNKTGYKYWKDAIFLYLISDDEDVGMCNYIYANIAKKYKKTPSAIDRAMRLCFENVMYNTSKIKGNYITDYLKSSLLYPHNSEILVKIIKLITSKEFHKTKNKVFNI